MAFAYQDRRRNKMKPDTEKDEVCNLNLEHALANRVFEQRNRDTKRILKLEKYSPRNLFYNPELLNELFNELRTVNPDIKDTLDMDLRDRDKYYRFVREAYF